MPVFPSQDLYGKKICETYQQLIQIYGDGLVLNGSGSQQKFLNVTASYALNCPCPSGGGKVAEHFISSSRWVFTHHLNDYPVVVQVYDFNRNQIVPSNIQLADDNTAIITFPVSESGWAIASTSGLRTITSGSTLITGSTYPITSSWALYALNGGTRLYTGSTYPITASWALNCVKQPGESVTGSFCGTSVWTFNHNLGNKYVIIQTYDEYDNQLIPEVVNLFDENTAIITFSDDACGTVIASLGGLNVVSSSTGGSSLITGSTYPITSSWALYAVNGGTKLQTGSTYPITASWALNCLQMDGRSVTASFNNSSVWTFNHNLGNRYVIVQAYDENNNQLLPNIINLSTPNTAIIDFGGMAMSGIAVASLGGLNRVTQSFFVNTGSSYPITSSWSRHSISASYAPCSCPIMHTGSTYPITSSWAQHTITSSYIQVTGVSYPVRRITGDYTIVRTTDYTILCDASAGSFNVKLPNPVGNTNIYNIKKIDTSGNCVHVTVTNASYIDYDLTQSICHRGTNMTIQSDSTNQYWIL